MGNCFTLLQDDDAASRLSFPSAACPTSSSSSSSSSSDCNDPYHCDSFLGTSSSSSSSSRRCPPRPLPPRRILPFPAPRDLRARYRLGLELGRGEFGVIRLCTCLSSGALFACKSISKLHMQRHLPDLLREVRVMQRLSVACTHAQSAYPVLLHQVLEDDSHVHLIMELCRGGELFDRIARKRCYTEAESASIIRRLMQTIQFCHSMGIMHRDVKPENILLVEDSEESPIRLADFGLALEFSPGQKFSTMAGSAYYIAPEVLRGEYSEEIDVWSAGVVLYVMLSGVPPFWGPNDDAIFNAIREANLNFAESSWKRVSFPCKDLIKRMLCVDVKKRLTPAQVLEHPWILHHSRASTLERSRKHAQTTPGSNIRMANICSEKNQLAAHAA